jgi:hypothetical protein
MPLGAWFDRDCRIPFCTLVLANFLVGQRCCLAVLLPEPAATTVSAASRAISQNGSGSALRQNHVFAFSRILAPHFLCGGYD